MSLGYGFRAGDWRLATDVAYSHPFGVWDDYEAAEKNIRSSSGYRSLEAAFFATEALNDIVALNAQVESGLSFPTSCERAKYSSDTSYALSAYIGLVISPGDTNLRIGPAKSLSDLDAMPRLSIAYSRSFRLVSEGQGYAAFILRADRGNDEGLYPRRQDREYRRFVDIREHG